MLHSWIIGMSENHNELKEKITIWLSKERFQADSITVQGAFFAISCRVNGQPISIVAWQNHDGFLTVSTSITLGDDQKNLLNEIPEDKIITMLWEIRLSLVNLVDRMRILDNHNESDWIQLQNTIYFEGLDREGFMRCIKRLHSASLTVIWIIEKYSGARNTRHQPPSLYQ